MNKDELVRISIESLPEATISFVDGLSALLTPTIAIVAVYIAYQQRKINEQRLRHETYERRLNVYKAVQKHLSIVVREGKTTFQECAEFYSEASEAAFLFDQSVMDRIDLIYEKSIDLVVDHEKLYLSDGSPTEPVGEERHEVVKRVSELLKWHYDQLKDSKEFFANKLGLKNT